MTVTQIAELAHETNRAYCNLIGDHTQVPWYYAPGWQKQSGIAGVKFRLSNPTAPASSQHEAWLENKIRHGWKCGRAKDLEKKEHPCCVPYDELPIEQKIKDTLFTSIVSALKPLLVERELE